MDLGLSDTQRMLQQVARRFGAEASPPAQVRAQAAIPAGFSRALWRREASLGWPGLLVPASAGGGGGSLLDLVAVLEVLGAFLTPGPLLQHAVAAMAVAASGAEAAVVEPLASGERIVTLAIAGRDGGYGAAQAGVHAAGTADRSYRLTGSVPLVPFATGADVLLLPAWLERGWEPRLGWFLVPAGAAGVGITPQPTMGGDPLATVTLDAPLPAAARLPAVDGHALYERILNAAAVAQAAWLQGMMDRMRDLTLDYAKQREQFGRAIGAFQAVQHRCVALAIDCAGTRPLVRTAAWRVDEGMAPAAYVSAAKARASDAAWRCHGHAHQVHGAVGFTREHDLHLWTRRVPGAAARYGDAAFHRRRVWEALRVDGRLPTPERGFVPSG